MVYTLPPNMIAGQSTALGRPDLSFPRHRSGVDRVSVARPVQIYPRSFGMDNPLSMNPYDANTASPTMGDPVNSHRYSLSKDSDIYFRGPDGLPYSLPPSSDNTLATLGDRVNVVDSDLASSMAPIVSPPFTALPGAPPSLPIVAPTVPSEPYGYPTNSTYTPYNTRLAIAKSSLRTVPLVSAIFRALIQIYKFSDPNLPYFVAASMNGESGFNPLAANPTSSARGLLQMIASNRSRYTGPSLLGAGVRRVYDSLVGGLAPRDINDFGMILWWIETSRRTMGQVGVFKDGQWHFRALLAGKTLGYHSVGAYIRDSRPLYLKDYFLGQGLMWLLSQLGPGTVYQDNPSLAQYYYRCDDPLLARRFQSSRLFDNLK